MNIKLNFNKEKIFCEWVECDVKFFRLNFIVFYDIFIFKKLCSSVIYLFIEFFLFIR